MKYKAKKTVTRENVCITKTVCDFCKKEMAPNQPYNETEVTIEARVGDVFPDGDLRDVTEFDCCIECWAKKVLPVLCALGAQPRVRDAQDYFGGMEWEKA